MKKLSVFFAAVMMFVAVGFTNAQKVAALDYQEILALMPETKKVTSELDTFSKTKEAELKKQADAFQAEVQKYQSEGAKMTEAQRQTKETELAKKQQDLQQLSFTAQQDLNKKRESLLQPVIDRLNNTIEKVSKAQGWDYVIDSSALIYSNGKIDGTAAVKKELGI